MDAAAVNTSADSGSPVRAGYRRSAGSPRGEARRRELLDRVTDDLAVNGLVDFSLRRAARAARTTHKVLLYHFAGADDLLRQAILQLRERRIDNALAAATQGPGKQTLAARVRAVWRALVGEESRVLEWFTCLGGRSSPVGGRRASAREPLLVPLAGPPGTVALLTTPDSLDGSRALNPGGRHPGWQQEVAARSALSLGSTGRDATRPGCAARSWSSSATRTSPRWPDPPPGRRTALPGASSSGCPAGITSRSSAATSERPRPRCPSCAGTCSTIRRPTRR